MISMLKNKKKKLDNKKEMTTIKELDKRKNSKLLKIIN